MKKAVTIRDVAQRAGVSVATASRVLNGKQVVSAPTRDRILMVREELGFTPSPAARRLRLGRTLTVGVVVSFLTRPQAAERLRGIDAVLSDSEFDLVICNVESVQKRDHYLAAPVHQAIGRGSAIAVIFFLVILLITILQRRLLREERELT